MPSVYKPGLIKCMHVEMTPEERQRLKVACALAGMSMRGFTRIAMLEATERQLEKVQTGQSTIFHAKKKAEPLRV